VRDKMKNIDLSPIKNLNNQYNIIVDTIESHYKCEWDDRVHDSYLSFIRQLLELKSQVKKIRSNAEILEKEVDNLKLEEIKNKSEILCKEADSI
jgi:hypothetical protein